MFCMAVAPLGAQEKTPAEAEAKPKSNRTNFGMLLSPQSVSATELIWRNGERLTGKLASGLATEIQWSSDMFVAPLRVGVEFLNRIDFDVKSDASPKGEFRMVLLDGSHLLGAIEEMNEVEVKFHGSVGSVITVKWDQVVSLQRESGGGVVSAASVLPTAKLAPNNYGGSNAKFFPWYYGAGGLISSPSYNQKVQWQPKVPDKGMLDVSFATDGVPAFAIGVPAGAEEITIETWDDEVVLTQGKRFATAGVRFKEADRKARLRLVWDRSTSSSTLYGPDGKVWAELPAITAPPQPISLKPFAEGPLAEIDFVKDVIPDPAAKKVIKKRVVKTTKSQSNMTLHNKGNGMIVDRFEVSEWSGQVPPAVVEGDILIETSTESILGAPIGKNAESMIVKLAADQQTREIPLSTVRSVRWKRTAKLAKDPTLTSVWFVDGEFVRGKLTEIKDGKATLETSFTAAPVTVALDACRTIVLPNPKNEPDLPPKEQKEALAKLDQLTTGKGSLHGGVEFTGGKVPQFRPTGAVEPAVPSTSDMTLVRAFPKDFKAERAQALLHVADGETIPAELTAISKESIEFNCDWSEKHTLPTAQLHAVQFSKAGLVADGFASPGWQASGKSKATIKDKEVTLQPDSGIAHMYAIQGDDIRFKMAGTAGSGTLRIRLFANSIDQKSGTTNFLLGDFGSSIYCGIESSEEGQLENQYQAMRGSGPVDVRMSFAGDSVQMYINDALICETKRKKTDKKTQGPGLILESASLWGNTMRPVKLSDFTVSGTSFVAAPPAFSADAKREALLLPRVHRDSPPKHILIGRNGDLLRGEVESMTSSHLLFRAGMENFKVPLDRVTSVVWLAKPDKNPPKEEPKDKDKKVEEKQENGGNLKIQGNIRIVLKKAAEEAADPFAPPTPAPEPEKKKEEAPTPETDPAQWLDLVNGGRISLKVESWTAEKVTGIHSKLGKCSIPVAWVHRVTSKAPTQTASYGALSDWKLVKTQDPVLPEDEATNSPLIGKDAADFSVPLLDGEDAKFSLADMKGKVVVLDFWATWCGPCVKSLPGLIAAMKEFPEDKVAFLTVNQGETKEQVRKFVDARGFKMPVGFDASQQVAKKYGVEGIPHTVVISRDGKIALVKTGFSPEGEKEIAAAVQKALE